jgi:hypothetical protein
MPRIDAFCVHQLRVFRFCTIDVHVPFVDEKRVLFFHFSVDCADEFFNDACFLCLLRVSLLSGYLFFWPNGSQNKEDEAIVFLCILPGTSTDYLFVHSQLNAPLFPQER